MKHRHLFSSILVLLTACTILSAPTPVTGMKRLLSLYTELPDRQTCDAGILSDREIQIALDTLNRIRQVHQLPPVRLDPSLQAETSKAALIVAASRKMNHTPPGNAPCYSTEGRTGSWNSNLHIARYTVWDPDPNSNEKSPRSREIRARIDRNVLETGDIMIEWLIDWRVEGVGHRRWLLDPFVERIAFARVDLLSRDGQRWDLITRSAVNIIEGTRDNIPDFKPGFVACPVGDYPSDWFQKDWYLSFTLMITGSSVHANRYAHFDMADIHMETEDGTPVTVTDVKWDDTPYGVPNIVLWKAQGLKDNERYHVTISNVRIGGIVKHYRYDFRLAPESIR